MVSYTDYNFYTREFGGSAIPEEAFLGIIAKASVFIRLITFDRVDEDDPPEEVQAAACAAAEALYSASNTQAVKAESVGNVSVSYVTEQKDGESQEQAIRRKEEEQKYKKDVYHQLKLLKDQDEEIERLQADYRERSEKTTKEILDSLTILSDDIRSLGERIEKIEFNKKIKKYRWDINNFATQLTRGVNYGKDQFDIIFQEHDEYQELLKEHHLSNGQTSIAMDVIRKRYKELYLKKICLIAGA